MSCYPTVSTLAGGQDTFTRSITVDSSGNFYVADITYNRIRKITPSGLVSTFAGSGTAGTTDGQGTSAKFNAPYGITVDSSGNFYVADTGNHRIRKITPSGLVSTIAGSSRGFLNGQGTTAQFNSPMDVAVDTNGNIYVSDYSNHIVRKITPSGYVSTFAGSGTYGLAEGVGISSQFYNPYGIALDSSGNVYVADRNNNRIRKITPEGLVSTLAGSGLGFANGKGTDAAFSGPQDIALDSSGNVYVADTSNHLIRKITPSGLVSTIAGSSQGFLNGRGTDAQFYAPSGITVVSSGDIYVADTGNFLIRRISCTQCTQPTGTQYVTGICTSTTDTVFSNAPTCVTGSTYLTGFSSGSYTTLGSPGMCTPCSQPTGTQYVTATCTPTTDTVFSNAPTCTSGQHLTGFSAGSPTSIGSPGTCGTCSAGTYFNGSFCTPCPSDSFSAAGSSNCSATCPVGTLYTIGSACLNTCPAGRWYNSTLLQCNTCPSGTFYVGPGATSVSDCVSCGPGTYSGIGYPSCLKCPVGTSFNGSRGTSDAVCTPCPAGQYSNVMGSAACSACPAGTDSVAKSSFCYRVTSEKRVITFVGSGSGFADGSGLSTQFNKPVGVAVDSNGNFYVADTNNNRIRKITPSGTVSTFAGSSLGYLDAQGTVAQFREPYGVAVDSSGNVYVTERNNRIRKITPTGLVSTLAGSGNAAQADGQGTAATFNMPYGVAVDSAGNVYVADRNNHKIRKITPAGLVSTLAGSGTAGSMDGQGAVATFNQPAGVAVDSSGNVYVAEWVGKKVRKITPSGLVSTLAVTGGLTGITLDSNGNIYVAETAKNQISKITPSGTVSVLTGSGTAGSMDGQGAVATFNQPAGVAVDSSGNIYIADSLNNRIRKITDGIVEDRGMYVMHTFYTIGQFTTLGNMDIYDELVITTTNIYSKGPRTLVAATYTVDPNQSTVGLLDRGSVYTTDYGVFQSGTVQYVIVYLKTPCPASAPKWDPLQKKCVAACSVPLSSDTSNVCTKCPTLTQVRSTPVAGAAYCEPGFTLTGLTCNGTSLTCPDQSWTLSGSLCTKTELRCPTGSILMPQNYCLFSNGVSMLQTSVDLILSATSTPVSKPAYGACVTDCPVNTYKSDDCVQCPGNQVTAITGATSVSACVCPVGTYGTNGSGVCTPCGQDQTSPQGTQSQAGCVMYCPVGSYASSTSTCTVCPYGTSPAGSMSISACLCAPGTFLNAGSCVSQCPAGMYKDNGTSTCIQCPGNQTSALGSVGISACVCPDGSGGLNGSGVCTPCTGGQTSTLTNYTCPDDSWTLTGSVCSKVSDYDCAGVSYDDLIESGQLLEPAEIDIGTTTQRSFTKQPTGVSSVFTFSLDLQIQNDTSNYRHIFQNIPGFNWPIDTSDKGKPLLVLYERSIWLRYSTNPGGPPSDYNFAIGSNFVPGTWFKCTCTVDGPNKTITMYINGVKQSQQTVIGGNLIAPTAAPSFTWRSETGDINNGYLKVKNVYWWNQVLSSDAIKLFAGLSVPGACYKTANTCYSTTYTCPTSACVLNRYTCPDASWTLNGSVCLKSGQNMTAPTVTCSCPVSPAQYTCPGGWTLEGNRCKRFSYYSCDNGGSEYNRNPTTGLTTVKSAWKLEENKCRRYTCSASTSQAGTYLTIDGNSCKFFNSTYVCEPGYRQEPYAGSIQTIQAEIPGCNKWPASVTDDYNVIVSWVPYAGLFNNYFVAESKTSNYCPPWGLNSFGDLAALYGSTGSSLSSVCNGRFIDYRPNEEYRAYKPTRCIYKKTGTSCQLCSTGRSLSDIHVPRRQYYQAGVQYDYLDYTEYDFWVSKISQLLSGTSACSVPYAPTSLANPSPIYKDQFITKLLDTYRAVPYYTTVPITVAAGDDIPGTPQYDYRPADPVMGDRNADNATLTRTQAQVMAIQTTNATSGSVQGRQCMCSGTQYMDLLNKTCVTLCPVATYADSATRTCQPCPANKTSPEGSTSSAQCVCSYATPYWTGFSCMQQLNPSAVVTGSGFTTRYENKYTIHEFTQSGSFTLLSPTIAKLWLVGGGAGGSSDGKPGGGGTVTYVNDQSLSGGTYTVTVGSGGGPNSSGGNTSLTGPGTNFTANGGTVLTSLTSSLAFRFINLGASTILYCQCENPGCTPPPPVTDSFYVTNNSKVVNPNNGVIKTMNEVNTSPEPTTESCAQACLDTPGCIGFGVDLRYNLSCSLYNFNFVAVDSPDQRYTYMKKTGCTTSATNHCGQVCGSGYSWGWNGSVYTCTADYGSG